METGEVVVNFAIAISAPDLYKQCSDEAKKSNLTESQIPSFSWFKFQFWPKDTTTHTALNYTGRFPVKYMMQQRMVRKTHDDEHYAAAIYKYSREYAVSIRDLTSLVCTDDKHKVSMGEPGVPVAALPRGRRVLVGNNQIFQVADHDFSNMSLIPTVILVNEIGESVDNSWYRGQPNVLVKITATSPSSALHNAREIANVLITKYGSKEQVPPVLIMYTDGGPEHRSNFLSVKIALIALQRFLDLDQILAARTAPGHSFINPAEKINCVLNLALYGIGCMRHRSSDQEYEKQLHNCSGLSDVGKLIEKNPERNTALLLESCKPCIDLIENTFSRLMLKDKPFLTPKEATVDKINELFESINLDDTLKSHDTLADLTNRPKLSQYLKHCCRERTYFFSSKKCGIDQCAICLPPRSARDDFNRLDHLPDPTPGTDDVHYKQFHEVFNTPTDESAMPSLKTTKDRGHKIPFNPVKQHGANTQLTIECVECSKLRIVYSAKKLSTTERCNFNAVMSSMLFTCGAILAEFKAQVNHEKNAILDKVFVRANNNCTKPIEALYYTLNYAECCCHCGSKRRLIKTVNEYPICTPCKVLRTRS